MSITVIDPMFERGKPYERRRYNRVGADARGDRRTPDGAREGRQLFDRSDPGRGQGNDRQQEPGDRGTQARDRMAQKQTRNAPTLTRRERLLFWLANRFTRFSPEVFWWIKRQGEASARSTRRLNFIEKEITNKRVKS
jgi:hypothetical protein